MKLAIALLFVSLTAAGAMAQTAAPAPAQAATPAPALGGPEPQHQGKITYVSGGAGDEDRTAMRQMARDYDLRLQFALEGSGEYLADVKVTLSDEAGKTLLDTTSEGPLFFAQVPAGRYKIAVSEGGRTQTRNLTVPASGALVDSFYWPAAK